MKARKRGCRPPLEATPPKFRSHIHLHSSPCLSLTSSPPYLAAIQSQGVVLRYAIQHRPGNPPDFILCLGDDASDEYMYTAIYSYIADLAYQREHDEAPETVGPSSCPSLPSIAA